MSRAPDAAMTDGGLEGAKGEFGMRDMAIAAALNDGIVDYRSSVA